ncbi:MAG TPA: methyltransferase domain-containing protein [Terriglobales bacterium]|nr:methyltransferase domain-containing protein [Terriglobales bacterium]
MMTLSTFTASGRAFDAIAYEYDTLFTYSVVGTAQRESVWAVLSQVFKPGDRVLELNCGTGEDALFLAHREIHVLACDASKSMIDVASRKSSNVRTRGSIQFLCLPTENIANLVNQRFDGVLSNFSGLNCVQDIAALAATLCKVVKVGSKMVLCVSSRICAWELLYYGVRFDAKRAFRRLSGRVVKSFDGQQFTVTYPTLAKMREAFSPWFRVRSISAVGLCIPPSYLEHWARSHPKTLQMLKALDRQLATLPLFRVLGDHVLVVFEKVTR